MTRGRRLYLDKDHAKLAGVCAGVADYLGLGIGVTRIAWIITACFWPPVMITAYVLMAWLIDPKPAMGYGASAPPPWPADPLAPRRRFMDVRSRFDRLEDRLRNLETVVTSREFQIDRELRA